MATRGAFLDGCPLLNSGHEWTRSSGARPSFVVCDLIPKDAETVLAKKMQPVDLQIDNMTARVLVLSRAPTGHQNIARVLVCDRRWYWQHIVMDRGFNVRRHIGIRRVSGGIETPKVLEPLRPSVNYEPWSLQSRNQVWKPKQILDSIMKQLEDAEKAAGFSWGGYSVDTTNLTKLEIEGLFIGPSVSDAIEQVLQSIPGLRLDVEPSGKVRFYSIANIDEEKDIVDKINPEFRAAGSVIESFTDFKRVRPKEIRVLFDIEAEVRFDFNESLAGGRTTANPDERTCSNVLPVTDFALNHTQLGTLAQGNWVKIDQTLFNSWGALPNGKKLNELTIRRFLTPYHDLFAKYVRLGTLESRADWASRFMAIKAHYRTTFKINQRWVDRYRKVKAHRVATWDPVTAARAPSLAYMNWFTLAPQRLYRGTGKRSYGENDGNFDGGQIESSTVAAPWAVQLLDNDQGIFSVRYVPDEFRLKTIAIPGKLQRAPSPGDVKNLAFDGLATGASPVELSSAFNLATILTLFPGTAGDRRHLFEVVIKPQDVLSFLQGPLREGLTEAEGPPIEVKVGPGIETARVAWSDRTSDQTERIFGLQTAKPNLDGLVINYVKENAGASVWMIAVAVAAQVYASYANRLQGQAHSEINLDLEMKGLMRDITYKIDSQGMTSQRVRMEDWMDFNIDREAFLPVSTRRFIRRIATVGRD